MLWDWLARLVTPPPLATVRLEAQSLSVERGKVPAELLREWREVALDLDLQAGRVHVRAGPHGPVLDFSPEIPARWHQRFRNVFGLHRERFDV